MKRFNLLGRVVVRLMAMVMVVVSLPIGYAQAGMVTTDQVLEAAELEQTREDIIEFLAREDVRQQLEALGVDPDEALARAENMTDAEVMQIAGQLEQLPAGQDALGTVLGVVIVIFLVLLVTDILGLTNVFPFVR